MGDKISRWWWGGDPDAKHEVSGLSLRDIYNLQKSWKTIQINSNQNGFLMFFRLFDAEPETKLYFKVLANLETEEEMAANSVFKAHIINIMSTLDNTIVHLAKPELVIAWMQKLGDSHQRNKVAKRYFWVLKDILVNILQNDLKFKEDVVESWVAKAIKKNL